MQITFDRYVVHSDPFGLPQRSRGHSAQYHAPITTHNSLLSRQAAAAEERHSQLDAAYTEMVGKCTQLEMVQEDLTVTITKTTAENAAVFTEGLQFKVQPQVQLQEPFGVTLILCLKVQLLR